MLFIISEGGSIFRPQFSEMAQKKKPGMAPTNHNESKAPPVADQLLENVIHIDGMYENWFLDYASYVILERAVPALEDGLKPVQRRIMHAMREMDDGRYNKVANIIGQTMQYHPHGDASIGEALVNLGQKDLLIDCQGNWGDIRTGDSAAAPRYIEARPSKFALEVAFNPKTTQWQLSYDGRKKEPVTLPIKYPLLLFQGVEGIAVGLATKVLPHNFIEILEACIAVLKGEKTRLMPDFPTGGLADCNNYNGGMRGGRIRIRANIEKVDNKTLAIRNIPFGTTTGSLIDSIIKAGDKNKIKIKQIQDNTAKNVEILLTLPPGISPDLTIDALYAFTDCEISVATNACVIYENKPLFLTVDEILRINVKQTMDLLKRELEIDLAELEYKWHMSSLEKIFIEKRIYRDIEECTTWESVIQTIDKGLHPFKKLFFRKITEEDIVKLTEIKIKRISKFDSFKADEYIRELEKQMAESKHHLAHLTRYAIDYYQNLLDKFGKGRERKTRLTNFETIEIADVVVASEKLYVNRTDGFIGTQLKKDEFLCECSTLDDIIVFRRDGKFLISKVADKVFVGKDIIHLAVWKKNDERTTYNIVFWDGKSKRNYVKRFHATALIRDKEYSAATDHKDSKIMYLSANPNGESEVIQVILSPACNAQKKTFDFDFRDLEIKGKTSLGIILTKWPIKKISRTELGKSSLGGRHIWYDALIGRINSDERGTYLGEFNTGDYILAIYKDGSYELTDFEFTNRYDYENLLLIEKYSDNAVISAVHFHGEKKETYVKRFKIETNILKQRYVFIDESKGSKLIVVSTHKKPMITMQILKGKSKITEDLEISLDDFIDVKGWKATGNKLSNYEVKKISLITQQAPVIPKHKKAESPEPGQQKLFGEEEETTQIIDRRRVK